MKLLTADKDPNFLNRLEARSQVVAPADKLDHIVRVQKITAVAPPLAPILDTVTGKDIAEPNIFVNPTPLKKELGFRPVESLGPVKFEKKILKNRKGKEFEAIRPYRDDPVTGEREYVDRRPTRGIRIASDANGNPLTFATKPGEVGVARRALRSTMAEMLDYDDDDPASLMARK